MPDYSKYLPDVLSRFKSSNPFTRLLFRSEQFYETPELNEAFEINQAQLRDVSNAALGRASLRAGGGLTILREEGKVRLGAAEIIADGLRYDVPAAEIVIPMEGPVEIGIAVVSTVITDVDDPTLKGIVADTESYGESLAARLVQSASWALDGDPFYVIYKVQDGDNLNNYEPPFSEMLEAPVERHIRQSHGSHIITGNLVRWMRFEEESQKQYLSISAGTLRANGKHVEKTVDTGFSYEELPTLETVNGEAHPINNNGQGEATIQLRNGPLASIETLTIHKEVTRDITHGVAGSADPLPDYPVVSVSLVKQGATTFVAGTDFDVVGNDISWSKPGAEPAPGSTYQVTYRYEDTIQPDSTDRQSLVVSGGVTGGIARVNYKFKLPRIDVLAVDEEGRFKLFRGISTRFNAVSPRIPADYAPLVRIYNNWGIAPSLEPINQRAVHEWENRNMFSMVLLLADKVSQLELRQQLAERDPSSSRGFFRDNFTDETQRDIGLLDDNTAAVFNGLCMLPITFTVQPVNLGERCLTLPYQSEIVLHNPWRTTTRKVNEYMAFSPLPGLAVLNPAVDRWNIIDRVDLPSVQTQRITWNGQSGQLSETELISRSTVRAEFLRSIRVEYALSFFGDGEILQSIEFDGVPVPIGAQKVADASGVMSGNFMVPDNIPAGVKDVVFRGEETRALAIFDGQGLITTETFQTTLTTLTRGRRQEQESSGNGPNSGDMDPIAQSFGLGQDRVLLGFDVEFVARGNANNHLIGNLRLASEDKPTGDAIAEGIIGGDFQISNPEEILESNWTAIDFTQPGPVLRSSKYCVALLSDDADHAIAVSQLGDQSNDTSRGFDARQQRWLRENVLGGVLSTSSNDDGYVLHPDMDMTLRVRAAAFTADQATIQIGTYDLDRISDVRVEMDIYDFGARTNVMLEMVRANGEIITFAPNTHLQLDQYLTEQVSIRMVLSGDALVSPIVKPDLSIFWGTLAETASYTSQAIAVDVVASNAKIRVGFDSQVPDAASINIKLQDGAAYVAPTATDSQDMGDGWQEREFLLSDFDKPETRIRLELTGNPANRPQARALRARATTV